MALSDMQVFNEYIMPATIETLGQMIDKFNAASNGSIRLSTTSFEGDFMQESFFSAIHTAQRRVDRYSSNTSVSAVDLTEVKHNSVKIAGGFGPIRFEPSQMTWLQRPTAQGVEVASRNFAEALLADQLNTAIAALVAAINNQGSNTTIDVSASSPVSYTGLNSAHAKFGDRSGTIVANVMNGATYHKFVEQNISNNGQLFQAGNVQVIDILGKAVVVTDSPALYESGTTNKVKVLGLTDSAAIVQDAGDIQSNIDTDNGKKRIETTLQMDYTFGLGLKGYAWDTANGGKSPSDAALATGSNWDKVVSDIKHTAGVMLVGDADA